ncbi:methyltransferase domain-containing protein [Trichocoleus sp. ST-U3]
MKKLPYSHEFYQHRDQSSRPSAEIVASILEKFLQPRSVLDAGCGIGTWLSVFREKGAEEVFGLDGNWVYKENLVISPENFRYHDLSQPFDLDKRFDLAISLEVAEHLPPGSADGFVRSLTDHAPVVLFSAAIPFQGGAHHQNEQWPEYWTELFRKYNFTAFDCLRPKLWEQSQVLYWYAQNILLYVSNDKLCEEPSLEKMLGEPTEKPARLIHPVLYEFKNNMVQNPEKLGIRKLVQSLWPAIKEKLATKG